MYYSKISESLIFSKQLLQKITAEADPEYFRWGGGGGNWQSVKWGSLKVIRPKQLMKSLIFL